MTAPKALLVDDEPDIREIGEMAMVDVGNWEVVLATSGFDAIDKLENFTPKVILLDMMMPGLTGLETLVKLRENPKTADIPVIFMTAKVQQSEVEEYIAKGAKGVIKKPFDPINLATEVEMILAT